MISTDAFQVGFLSSLTIVNEESSLTIVNKGLYSTIVNEYSYVVFITKRSFFNKMKTLTSVRVVGRQGKIKGGWKTGKG